jgi:hypothetical protein
VRLPSRAVSLTARSLIAFELYDLATNTICTDVVSPREIRATANESCGWINSHEIASSSDVVVGVMNLGASDECQFRITNALPSTEEIVFLIKDFDVGSGSGDTMSFATDDGRWNQVVVREPGVVPGLVVPPPLAGSPTFIVRYTRSSYGGGYGSGFSILWAAKSSIARCLNSRTIVSNKTDSIEEISIDFSTTPSNRRIGNDAWYTVVAQNPRTTVSSFAFMTQSTSFSTEILSGRGIVYGSQTRIVDAYASLPDTGSRLQLYRFSAFGIPQAATISAALSVLYFVPSAAAADFDNIATRTASAAGVPFHFSVFSTPTGPFFSSYGSDGRPVAAATSFFSDGRWPVLDSTPPRTTH